jgi:hypothetical protein
MQLVISRDGAVRCVYDEAIRLREFGPPVIERASHVEPDAEGRWWADLAPVAGPRLGPFATRSPALAAECDWLNEHWLCGQMAVGRWQMADGRWQ